MQRQLFHFKMNELIILIVLSLFVLMVGAYLFMKMFVYYSNMRDVVSAIV